MKNLICRLLGHKYGDVIEGYSVCSRCDKLFKITFIKWGELVSGWEEKEVTKQRIDKNMTEKDLEDKTIDELINLCGGKFEGFRCESPVFYGFDKKNPKKALINLCLAIYESKEYKSFYGI